MVTDKVMTNVADWQNRLLDKVYPIVYMDAMYFKVRDDGRVVNRAAYICLGINKEGMKDILGIWIGESEGAKFWLGVCNELKARGVQDILLACVDGLKGFPEAIKSVFPDDEALKKSLYLGTMDILKKWTMPVANWGQVVAQFAVLFEGRLELGL
jgi:transposase-like protein